MAKKKKEQMELPSTGKAFSINQFSNYSTIYLETGSCMGESINRALDAGFKDIYSVEIEPRFVKHCASRFLNHSNVHLYLGNSVNLLPVMLDDAGMGPFVILLDAHPSGPNTGGHDDLMKHGDQSAFHQHTIIQKELELILNHRTDHVILIDDVNGDNEESRTYVDILKKANPGYECSFYNEGSYENKFLVCIPKYDR